MPLAAASERGRLIRAAFRLSDDTAAASPVLIAGAGIGGLSAALFLARRGIASTLLERRTILDEAGAGIQLSPNASRLLIEAGLGPALSRIATSPSRVVMRDLKSGRALAHVPLDRIAEREGAPYWVVRRADLHRILLDTVRGTAGIRLLIGRRLTGWRGEEGGVAIETLSDGGRSETLAAPLLVCADGIGSQGAAGIGDRRGLTFAGSEAWRALVPIVAVPAALRGMETGVWLGRDGHAVHYPVSGELMNLVVIAAAGSPREGYGTPGDGPALAARLGRTACDLAALIAAAPDWRVWSLFERPVGPMTGQRVALLGDAAHPLLPFLAQGGALAIEDAAVLARCLAEDAIPEALASYEALRRPRATRVQAASREAGRIYHLSGPLALARNAVLRHTAPDRLAARYDWLYGWRQPTAESGRNDSVFPFPG